MISLPVISIQHILSVFPGRRLSLGNEKLLQQSIDGLFISAGYKAGVDYSREYRLDNKNIPDFYFHFNNIAIEVKIKGSARAIYAQCERYCEHPDVSILLLITNKAIGFPKEINGKPSYFLNLGTAWL